MKNPPQAASRLFGAPCHPRNTAHGRSPRVKQPTIQHVLPLGQLFTAYLHEAVRRIFEAELLPLARVELTRREKECLLWAAEGKTSDETADILHISESTVRFHLNNAARKLNVHNRRHAIARAICLGLIKPVI